MKAAIAGTALAAMLGLMISGVIAQQATQPNRDQQQLGTQRQGQQFDRQGQTAGEAKMIIRASEVIGMSVKNNRDEDLGAIEDLAIDPNTGRVAYAAVSMGGFLGLGDKLFAVPWNSIECRTEEGGTVTGTEARVAILDVSKEQLEDAQGFDQDNWPNMADARWREQNDRHYRATQRPERTDEQRR